VHLEDDSELFFIGPHSIGSIRNPQALVKNVAGYLILSDACTRALSLRVRFSAPRWLLADGSHFVLDPNVSKWNVCNEARIFFKQVVALV